MLAGAVDPLTPLTFFGFNSLMALTKSEPAPFDRNRSGLLIGEGAGMLVLERASFALKRGAKIYAELVGYGLSNDAYHPTQPHPDGEGAVVCMRAGLKDANIKPDEVEYINAHGTGTKFNDLMELKAIKRVFGQHAESIPISSIKAAIGHTLGAAGTIEAIATILALYYDFLPPNLNYIHPIDDFNYRVVSKPEIGIGLKTAMSTSFAFGGNCAALLFKSADSLSS